MSNDIIKEVLHKHALWLDNSKGGKRANLKGANLEKADLKEAELGHAFLQAANMSGTVLRYAVLEGAFLDGANLSNADLHEVDLTDACLKKANLSRADLSDSSAMEADLCSAVLRNANLCNATLWNANLVGADLTDVTLRGANLRGANMINATLKGVDLVGVDLADSNLYLAYGLMSPTTFIKEHFERTPDGYIAYAVFKSQFSDNLKSEIKSGSVVEEEVCFDRREYRARGINVAPIDWVKANHPDQDIWRVLIRWEWLPGVCVPFNSDGIIRCERVELLEIVKD